MMSVITGNGVVMLPLSSQSTYKVGLMKMKHNIHTMVRKTAPSTLRISIEDLTIKAPSEKYLCLYTRPMRSAAPLSACRSSDMTYAFFGTPASYE
jgi:hypothetical protein